jgi:hypothetical protein
MKAFQGYYKVRERPRSVLMKCGRGLPLVVKLREVDTLSPWNDYGFPKEFWMYDGNTIVVWPSPDKAYYFDVEYHGDRDAACPAG